MPMRSSTAPRRIYVRGGVPFVCFGGVYFAAPQRKDSEINPKKEVTIEVLPKAGGKRRIAVTQNRGPKGRITENWVERTFEVNHRTPRGNTADPDTVEVDEASNDNSVADMEETV